MNSNLFTWRCFFIDFFFFFIQKGVSCVLTQFKKLADYHWVHNNILSTDASVMLDFLLIKLFFIWR